jgi:hypothetical protein
MWDKLRIQPRRTADSIGSPAEREIGFNWTPDSYGRISEWAASANRAASLLLALDQIDGQTSTGTFAGADRNVFADPAGTLTSD